MLSVVPAKVKLKVSLLGLGTALILVALLYFPPRPLNWLLALALVARGLMALWTFWPKFNLKLDRLDLKAHPLFKQGPKGQPKTPILTFDDGPTPTTEKILDLLLRHKLRASFFLLSSKARAHPKLVRRMVDEGHLIGLHGETHALPFRKSTSELTQSLSQALRELESLSGQKISLYRPSHGWKTLALRRAAHSLQLKFCFWDVGVWDTDNPSAELLEQKIKRVIGQGKVLLLHDGRDDLQARAPHEEVLLKALDRALSSPQMLSIRANSR